MFVNIQSKLVNVETLTQSLCRCVVIFCLRCDNFVCVTAYFCLSFVFFFVCRTVFYLRCRFFICGAVFLLALWLFYLRSVFFLFAFSVFLFALWLFYLSCGFFICVQCSFYLRCGFFICVMVFLFALCFFFFALPLWATVENSNKNLNFPMRCTVVTILHDHDVINNVLFSFARLLQYNYCTAVTLVHQDYLDTINVSVLYVITGSIFI